MRNADKKDDGGRAKVLQDAPELQSLHAFDSFQRLIEELDKK
jgi:hypothetical protein